MTTPRISAIGFSIQSLDGSVASLEPALRAHADRGVEAIEIAASSLDLVAGGRLLPRPLAELEQLTRSYPFTYTVHGLVASNFMDPETQDRQVRAALAMTEVCGAIGATILVQHSGSVEADRPGDRAGAEGRELEALRVLGDAARRHDVRIALENIFTTASGQFRRTPSEVAAAVRELDHPQIVALIDISHAYIEATHRGLDFRAELRAMASVAGHLHVHDSFGQPEGATPFFFPSEQTALGLGDLHLPLGWGDIAWDDIAADLEVLPGTVLMMEIGERYRAEHEACLSRAREIAARIG
jgi:sugar phosphate isomerase/epimerase